MLLSERINELFTASIESVADRISNYSISFTTSTLPDIQELSNFVYSLPGRDKINITLEPESNSYLELSRDNLAEKIDEYAQYTSESDIHIRIKIDKNIVDNTISIYDFQNFSSWLFNKTDISLLSSFNKLLENRTNIIGEIYDDEQIQVVTNTITFATSKVIVAQNNFNRLERLNTARVDINFYNIDKYSLVPDDFKIIECSDDRYKTVFSRLNTFLSMIYLSSISSIDIDSNKLCLQIQGKLSKEFDYTLDNNFKENNHLFDIYNWVYSGDNHYDRLLIARNIITLHCRTTKFADIDDKTISSIKSNYKLYLQKSVTDYLNLKNKLSEFLIEMNSKCSSLISQQVKHLTGNIVAFLSFISMVFLINLVSYSKLDNIFTSDVLGICDIFIIGSIIYCIISHISTNCQLSSIQTSYDSLKKSYRSILEEIDLNTIFNEDDEFNNEKNRVEYFSKRLLVLWLILIVIIAIVIHSLC